MSKSKKKIKIKHRKYSFYSKKKSKGKQALTIILMIVVVIALCVVGYGLGKPLMDYFSGQTSKPEATTSETASSVLPTEEADEPTVEAEDTKEAEPEPQTPAGVYEISVASMKNADTLRNALASAKTQGYESVLLTLKTDGGQFLYKTEVEAMRYATTNVVGTLSAKEIADIVKAQGMTAYAAVSTLKDPLTGDYAVNMRYNTADGYGWLDAAYDNGGKSWLSPFEQDTINFMAGITSELAAAGFDRVVLCDVMYPMFKEVDYSYYLSNMPQLTDNGARAAALWNVVSACDSAAKSNGAEVMLQVDSDDVFAAELLGTTAEVFADKSKLSSVNMLINYTPESGAAYSAAKSFAGRIGSTYSTLKYSVRIDTAISVADAENIAKAFEEAGIEVFSE